MYYEKYNKLQPPETNRLGGAITITVNLPYKFIATDEYLPYVFHQTGLVCMRFIYTYLSILVHFMIVSICMHVCTNKYIPRHCARTINEPAIGAAGVAA